MPTITGTALLPDAVGPLLGFWTISIHSNTGIAFEGTDAWRATEKPRSIGDDGSLSWTLPATTEDYLYSAVFTTLDRRTSLGPFIFQLLADITWQDVIGSPTLQPLPGQMIILDAAAPVPDGTPPGTVILRRT